MRGEEKSNNNVKSNPINIFLINTCIAESELVATLAQAVTEAEKCAAVASHLATKKVRTRTRGAQEAKVSGGGGGRIL